MKLVIVGDFQQKSRTTVYGLTIIGFATISPCHHIVGKTVKVVVDNK